MDHSREKKWAWNYSNDVSGNIKLNNFWRGTTLTSARWLDRHYFCASLISFHTRSLAHRQTNSTYLTYFTNDPWNRRTLHPSTSSCDSNGISESYQCWLSKRYTFQTDSLIMAVFRSFRCLPSAWWSAIQTKFWFVIMFCSFDYSRRHISHSEHSRADFPGPLLMRTKPVKYICLKHYRYAIKPNSIDTTPSFNFRPKILFHGLTHCFVHIRWWLFWNKFIKIQLEMFSQNHIKGIPLHPLPFNAIMPLQSFVRACVFVRMAQSWFCRMP